MSIEQLRSTFADHAAGVTDTSVATRAEAARGQAARIRRNRIVGAVVTAAVALPLGTLALLSVNPMDHDGAVGPAQPVRPQEVFEQTLPGRTPIESRVVTGESELTLTVGVSPNTDWRPVCLNAGPAYVLNVAFDNGSPATAPCDMKLDSGYRIGYRLGDDQPQGFHTIHLWLTKASDNRRTAPPEAVLGAAVYQLPRPVTSVLANDIYGVETDEGLGYTYVRSDISERGVDRFSSTQTASDGPIFVDWYSAGTNADDATVTVLVDGDEETSFPLGAGGLGLPLPLGKHTVELRVDGTAPADAQLALVWRSLR